MVVHTFKPSLVYRASSRAARAVMQRNPVSKKQNRTEQNKSQVSVPTPRTARETGLDEGNVVSVGKVEEIATHERDIMDGTNPG